MLLLHPSATATTIVFHDDNDDKSFITIFEDDDDGTTIIDNEEELIASSCSESSSSSEHTCNDVGDDGFVTCASGNTPLAIIKEGTSETTTTATRVVKARPSPNNIVSTVKQMKPKYLPPNEKNYTKGINLRFYAAKRLFEKAICPQSGMNHEEKVQVSTFLFQVSQDSIKAMLLLQEQRRLGAKQNIQIKDNDNRGLQMLQKAIQLQNLILEETMQDLLVELTRVVHQLGQQVSELAATIDTQNSTIKTSSSLKTTVSLLGGDHFSNKATLKRRQARYQTLRGMLQILYDSPSLSSLLPEIGDLLFTTLHSLQRHHRRSLKLQGLLPESFLDENKQNCDETQWKDTDGSDLPNNVVEDHYRVAMAKLSQATHETILKQNMEQVMNATCAILLKK